MDGNRIIRTHPSSISKSDGYPEASISGNDLCVCVNVYALIQTFTAMFRCPQVVVKLVTVVNKNHNKARYDFPSNYPLEVREKVKPLEVFVIIKSIPWNVVQWKFLGD